MVLHLTRDVRTIERRTGQGVQPGLRGIRSFLKRCAYLVRRRRDPQLLRQSRRLLVHARVVLHHRAGECFHLVRSTALERELRQVHVDGVRRHCHMGDLRVAQVLRGDIRGQRDRRQKSGQDGASRNGDMSHVRRAPVAVRK